MSNKITCNNYVYSGDDIVDCECFIGNSLAAEELSIDTLDPILKVVPAVFTTSDGDSFTTSDGYTFIVANPISGYKYGDEIIFEHDNSLIGKFYFEKAVRQSQVKYEFSNTSIMGILANADHYGGIYIEVPAGTIIADIMGDIPYSIYSDVSSVFLDGWLPKAKRRENLQQVLFAVGAGILKDSSGNLVIRFIEPTTPSAISSDRIYRDGTVDPGTPCTEVDVTEHAFFALSADVLKTLFDTSASVTSQTVLFDNPCHDLTATGLTIESSGVNYAVVSGAGTLTGKEYTHTKTVVPYSTGIAGTENIKTVTDATLVSTFNSYNVALRVAQYYSAVSTASIGLIVGEERPATEVSFTDPFGDFVSGYIKSMNITMSTILKAAADIAIGFLPVGHGNNYNHFALLTGSGTWTVPTGVTRLFAILVGGGKGGSGGHGGNPGASYTTSATAGVGGDGGGIGTGGLILTINQTVTPGAACSYSSGTGGTAGTGGVSGGSGTSGAAGTATTFGALTSASGLVHDVGYSEPKSGLALGTPGSTAGVTGGSGSIFGTDGGSVNFNGNTYSAGSEGASILALPGIVPPYACCGGYGGGAAAGSNGGNGGNGRDVYVPVVINGEGGTGATPIAGASASNYGSGGNGGHGGGGGGEAGYYNTTAIHNMGYEIGSGNSGGLGGSGSSGGTGGAGCIVIYY